MARKILAVRRGNTIRTHKNFSQRQLRSFEAPIRRELNKRRSLRSSSSSRGTSSRKTAGVTKTSAPLSATRTKEPVRKLRGGRAFFNNIVAGARAKFAEADARFFGGFLPGGASSRLVRAERLDTKRLQKERLFEAKTAFEVQKAEQEQARLEFEHDVKLSKLQEEAQFRVLEEELKRQADFAQTNFFERIFEPTEREFERARNLKSRNVAAQQQLEAVQEAQDLGIPISGGFPSAKPIIDALDVKPSFGDSLKSLAIPAIALIGGIFVFRELNK